MASSKPNANMSGTKGTDEEVDTDKLQPEKDEFYDPAEEAMPDITSSGDSVHAGASVSDVPMLTDEEREKLEAEMKQVENDVSVLQDALHNKLGRLHTIRCTLGLETNQNVFRSSFHKIRGSGAFKKTSETVQGVSDKITHSDVYHKTGVVLKTTGEKTKETFTTVGASMSRKLGEMRNSNTFKSVEARMGSAYSSVKKRMSGSRSEDDIGSVTVNSDQLPKQDCPPDGHKENQ